MTTEPCRTARIEIADDYWSRCEICVSVCQWSEFSASRAVYENKLKAIADEFHVATDDGSKGPEGLGFLPYILKAQIFDHTMVMGPVSTLKKVVT